MRTGRAFTSGHFLLPSFPMKGCLVKNSKRFPHLLKADIFQDLPLDFRKTLLNDSTCQIYKEPTLILSQGDASPGMYMVAHGALDIVYLGREGHAPILCAAISVALWAR